MSRVDKFSERLYAAQNTDELCGLLNEINERANTDIEFRPRRIRMAVFNALRDNLGKNENKAHEVIQDLWRLGISGVELIEPSQLIEEGKTKVHMPSRSQEDLWEQHEARELLGKWIAEWVDFDGPALREKLCDLTCKSALDSNASISEIKAACWTLGEIGWRSEEVEKTLWRLLERDDVAGDVAGGILVNLGLTSEQRDPFIAQLRERAKRRPIRYNAYPMQRLGAPELVEDALLMVQRHSDLSWHDGKARDESKSDEFDLASKQAFLSHMAVELRNFEEVQDKIWNAIYEKYHNTEDGRNSLLFTGNLAPWCDSTSLVSDFLRLLPDVFNDERQKDIFAGKSVDIKETDVDPHHFSIHIAAERLQAAYRPRQLTGWQNVKLELLTPFTNLALRNTWQTGYHSTSPMTAKEDCWKMLAFAGGCWDSEKVQIALANESSGFVQGSIANIIACFGCEPLPQVVSDILTLPGNGENGTRDISTGEDSSVFFGCRGMENLARATATKAAFDALLSFNFVYAGEVLRSTNDALNEVAAYLILNNDTSVEETLWRASDTNVPSHQRDTAISALHYLAHQRLLSVQNWENFANLAQEDNIDDYFRALSVQAIGFLDGDIDSDVILDVLLDFWLSHRGEKQSSFVSNARQALIRRGYWQRLSSEHQYLLLTDLKLELVDNKWRASSDYMVEPEDIATLHALYQQFPEEFELAICEILMNERNEPAYALVFELINFNSTLPIRLSESIVNSILSQLRSSDNEKQGFERPIRQYLFDALSLGAPQALLNENWKVSVNKWPSEVRVVLADAIGRTDRSSSDLKNTANTLESLCHDSSFIVRRSGLRAAKILMPEKLQVWCKQWSQSEWHFERCIAAEGVFWLDDAAPQEVIVSVLNDREGSVRQAARESAEKNQQRQWADYYLSLIESAVHTVSTPADVFRYGAALQKVGDDWHLHRLRYRRFEIQSPAMRFWWKEITEGLDKDWRDRTRDWNHLGQGVISLHDDAVLVIEDKRIDIEIWLWEQPRAGIRSRSSWGGRFRVKDASYISISSSDESDNVFIELRDGRRGKILVSNSKWSRGERNESTASFSGQRSLEKSNS